MENKVREVTVPTISYLNDVRGGDISENQDVQRRFCSDNSFINGIAVTVLTGDYLPPVILGEIPLEHGMVQQYIVDAMQRTSALMKIRFGNYRITSTIEDSVIEYQSKKCDENGKICKDESGGVIWEQKEFDIKNKTFDDFPEELKKRFDIYQLRVVIHQNCTMEKISKLIRRYNNHRAMNASQKAFTYLDLYARKVRTISETGFFKNCMNFSEAENKKGTYEKLVCESVMSIFYLDKWKKLPKQMNIFLNENASNEDFDTVQEYADRMETACDDKFTDIFVSKDIAVWFAVFHKFSKLGLSDSRFADFICELKTVLHNKKIDGYSYDSLDKESGTKDKKVIINKINTLEKLMLKFLHINIEETKNASAETEVLQEVDTVDFIKEIVVEDIETNDIEFYETLVEDCVKVDSPLYINCKKALIALMTFACREDKDKEFEEWIKMYEQKNISFSPNQKVNYTYMKRDFENYLSKNGAVA